MVDAAGRSSFGTMGRILLFDKCWHMRVVVLLMLVLFVATFGSSSAQDVAPTCNAGDRAKLLQFKSILYDPENTLDAWQPDSNCCEWSFPFAIECNAAGRVIQAYFTDSFDNDTLPADYQVKVKRGVHNPGASLGDLTELTGLYMRRVSFGFAYAVPTQFGKLVKLKKLNIENCDFIGKIPQFIGNFVSLSELGMTGNRWTGGIPDSIGNLKELRILSLPRNGLTIIGSSKITQLTKLDFVNFDDNKISGSIPKWLGDLKIRGTPEPIGSTGILRLAGNPFTGQIPGELCNIKGLEELYLFGTGVTGISPKIANCKKLLFLHLNDNKLQGQFPVALTQLPLLKSLKLGSDARHRNQLTGTLPPGIGDLPNLIEFDIGNNKLHGPIPSNYGPFELGSGPGTRFSGNNLSGRIPMSLRDLPADRFRPGNPGLCGAPLQACK